MTSLSEGKRGSLKRAAKLLAALAESPRGAATAVELARLTSLPRPTVHRVVDELCALGWLLRDPLSGQLEMAVGLTLLAQTNFVARLQRAASLKLTMLARRLGQTMYLDVRSGLDLCCVGRYADNSCVERDCGFVGMRAPFGSTPASMAMLASMHQEDIDVILEANAGRYAALPGFDHVAFMRSLRKADAAGTGYGAIALDRRMCGLGVAIVDLTGTPVAGIGMSYPWNALSRQRRAYCLANLEAAAQQISVHVA